MLSASSIVLLATALQVKHFIADFAYQPPYQWQNKGTYGHPGGIIHSGQHALATFLILCFLISPTLAFFIAISEFIIHYHIDWSKMNLNKAKGWGPTTHNEFWVLLGLDQVLHQLTYVGILGAVLYVA